MDADHLPRGPEHEPTRPSAALSLSLGARGARVAEQPLQPPLQRLHVEVAVRAALASSRASASRVGDLGSLSHWAPDRGCDGTQGVHHVDEADVPTGRSDQFSAGMLLLDMLLGLDARQAYGDLQDQGAIDEALALDFATLREQRGEDEQADLDVLTAEIARMMRFDGAERPSAWESHDRLANHRR